MFRPSLQLVLRRRIHKTVGSDGANAGALNGLRDTRQPWPPQDEAHPDNRSHVGFVAFGPIHRFFDPLKIAGRSSLS